jgi:hypothetical protein
MMKKEKCSGEYCIFLCVKTEAVWETRAYKKYLDLGDRKTMIST